MSELATLVFNNADATPKTEVVRLHPDSVAQVMCWYGSHFAGDRYTVALDGRNVPMDINGEPVSIPMTRPGNVEHDT